jgi:predicted ferric reductase
MKTKKAKLYGLMVIGLGFPALCWALVLVPGLPWSVYLYELGRLFALMAFGLIFFQYLLSSRIKVFERDIGLDFQFRIHKICGMVILILVLAHPTAIVISEKLQGYGSPMGVVKMIGVITLVIVIVAVAVAALNHAFRLSYEGWKRIHRIAYVLFPLGFVHSFFLGSGVQRLPLKLFWLVLALCYLAVITHKLVRRYQLRRHPWKVNRVVQETHDTWTLVFEGYHPSFLPGQFMALQLEEHFAWQSHPFTIASSPTQKDLSITVKAVGDYTSSLWETKTFAVAAIDMPFGTFSFLNHPAKELVFVAGGIGITPFMSMLRYMRDKKEGRPIVLLWSNKYEKDIAFRAELLEMEQAMPTLRVVHIISRQADWTGEKGHVDADKLRAYVNDFSVPRFFICGPFSMMNAVEGTLKVLGVPSGRIHVERFAL